MELIDLFRAIQETGGCVLRIARSWAMCCVAIALISAGVLAAGDESQQAPSKSGEELVYTVGPGITAPRVIKQVQPTFSGVNFQRNGLVTVSLIVNVEGLPEKVTITHGLDPQTDKSVIDAVKLWRFTPGKKESEAVAVRITIELRFHDV